MKPLGIVAWMPVHVTGRLTALNKRALADAPTTCQARENTYGDVTFAQLTR
jgi:hypothetical protein